MMEKQLSETRWGVKIYFPHFHCMKTLFLICSNPAVAFTQQGDSVAFKATLRHRHTSYTWGCLPRWRVLGGREQKRISITEKHTETGIICTAWASRPTFMASSIQGAESSWCTEVSMAWQKCVCCLSLQMNDCENLEACLSMHCERL